MLRSSDSLLIIPLRVLFVNTFFKFFSLFLRLYQSCSYAKYLCSVLCILTNLSLGYIACDLSQCHRCGTCAFLSASQISQAHHAAKPTVFHHRQPPNLSRPHQVCRSCSLHIRLCRQYLPGHHFPDGGLPRCSIGCNTAGHQIPIRHQTADLPAAVADRQDPYIIMCKGPSRHFYRFLRGNSDGGTGHNFLDFHIPPPSWGSMDRFSAFYTRKRPVLSNKPFILFIFPAGNLPGILPASQLPPPVLPPGADIPVGNDPAASS